MDLTKFIFQGYRDIVRNFWGFNGDEYGPISTDALKWWREPLVFLSADECEEENPLLPSLDYGDHEKEIPFYGVKILLLYGDGGFASCLIKVSDVERIKSFCNGNLPLIENPNA